jgi:hypothetical protein
MEDKLVLENDGLGSLKDIADCLWKLMNQEIEKYGYSDLTLGLEGCARGIYDIIRLNNIAD